MKILWSVNIFPPEIASLYGIIGHPISWVSALCKELVKRDDIELAIAAPIPNGNNATKKVVDRITSYPLTNSVSANDWDRVISDFHPDIIHIYGSEHPQNLVLVRNYKKKIPIIVSIQGLIGEISKYSYAGIDMSTILKNITIRDIARGSILRERRKMKCRAGKERELFNCVRYVEGRTNWDRVNTCKINPELIYYSCPRLLRAPFYTHSKWEPSTMERHTIFLGQANQPIKGFHIFLQALSLVKKKYPDVVVNIAGSDIYRVHGMKSVLHRKGYHKYVYNLIKEYGLDSNIKFLGYLDEKAMAAAMTNANVIVIPSAIENSPNTLAEGMMLGVPCIASYVGGAPEMLTDSVDGFLYNYGESGILADKICSLFADDILATMFSERARERAQKRHERNTIVDNILSIYLDVMQRNSQ